MAFSPRIKDLLAAGSLSVLMLVAVQEAAQAEPVVSSYYGGELAGSPTASGEPFNPQGMTAAHPTLPLGTTLTVGYNDRSVNVRVNDRGPFVHGRGLDLSLGAAQRLGLTGPGTGVVDIKPAGAPEPKPPVPNNEPAQQAAPTRAAMSTGTTTPDEAQEPAESLRFLSERMLASPGKRIADSISRSFPSPTQAPEAPSEPTSFEEPPATQVPEIREVQNTQPLQAHPTIPGRRRIA